MSGVDEGNGISSVTLEHAGRTDIEPLHRMQVEAFRPLYDLYGDTATSPACESLERLLAKYDQPATTYYFILLGDVRVGAMHVVDKRDGITPKRIAPIFLMPLYRNRGYAQRAIRIAERLHGEHGWALDTILEEAGNCHLYEKLGYRRTGEAQQVNARMTIVQFVKD